MKNLNEFSKIGQRIENSDDCIRIDAYLSKKFPFLSRVKWKARIQSKNIFIQNDKQNDIQTIKSTYHLKKYDQIWYSHSSEKQQINPEQKIDVLYDDGDICIFSKPPNLVVHPVGVYGKNNFITHIQNMGYADCSPVHRIDRETSGLLVCARKAQTRKEISELFRQNKINKIYIALSKGKKEVQKEFTIDHPIGSATNSQIRLKHWVHGNNAVPSSTHFKTLASLDDMHLFACIPKTGRTNQIRIHLASENLWIVGDKMYHPNEQVFLEYFEKGYTDWVQSQTLFSRQILHNAGIFIPGFTKELILCPLSQDLIAYPDFIKLLELTDLKEDLNQLKRFFTA